VEDPEGHGQLAVAQIGVEVREVVGRAERLVGHGAVGERDRVGAGHVVETPPGAVGAQLDLLLVQTLRPQEDELLDRRQARPGLVAQRLGRDRHRPPTGRLQPFLRARGLDGLAGTPVPQEDHGEPAARLGPKRRRDRQQHPGAVARQPVGGSRAAVTDVGEAREQEVDDGARGATRRIGDEADPAGVSFDGWVVEECA
jgi:hypothetical protein